MDREAALHFGVGLGSFAVIFMGLMVNLVSAVILAVSILFYVLVYTAWLKPRTPQNIVIGGAAGAFPPLIGWAAATGDVTLMPVLLFAIIFLWTPPHFWALALVKAADYGRAGIPMMPNVAGPAATRRQIVLYTLIMAPVAVLPALMGFAGLAYLVVSVASWLSDDGRWFARITGYRLKVEDQISYGVGRYVNIDRTLTTGIEAEVEADLTDRFSVKVAYAFTDAVDGTTGAELIRAPENAGSVTLLWTGERLKAALTVRAEGEQADSDPSTFSAAAGR
eukprot:gene29199-38676_t